MSVEFVGEGEGSDHVIFELYAGGNVSVRAGELRDCVEGCGDTEDIGWSECPEDDWGRTLEVFMVKPTRCREEGVLGDESNANGNVSAAMGYSLGSKLFKVWSK